MTPAEFLRFLSEVLHEGLTPASITAVAFGFLVFSFALLARYVDRFATAWATFRTSQIETARAELEGLQIRRLGNWLSTTSKTSEAGVALEVASEALSGLEDLRETVRKLEEQLQRVKITAALRPSSKGYVLELHNKHQDRTAGKVSVRLVGVNDRSYGPMHLNRGRELDIEPGGRIYLDWSVPVGPSKRQWMLSLSWREDGRLVHEEVPVWNPTELKPG